MRQEFMYYLSLLSHGQIVQIMVSIFSLINITIGLCILLLNKCVQNDCNHNSWNGSNPKILVVTRTNYLQVLCITMGSCDWKISQKLNLVHWSKYAKSSKYANQVAIINWNSDILLGLLTKLAVYMPAFVLITSLQLYCI